MHSLVGASVGALVGLAVVGASVGASIGAPLGGLVYSSHHHSPRSFRPQWLRPRLPSSG